LFTHDLTFPGGCFKPKGDRVVIRQEHVNSFRAAYTLDPNILAVRT